MWSSEQLSLRSIVMSAWWTAISAFVPITCQSDPAVPPRWSDTKSVIFFGHFSPTNWSSCISFANSVNHRCGPRVAEPSSSDFPRPGRCYSAAARRMSTLVRTYSLKCVTFLLQSSSFPILTVASLPLLRHVYDLPRFPAPTRHDVLLC